ncbi:hypothetical protein H5410_046965 [Solanum commersonii]|uniref:Uncharacterized protein n=1 Tax=Solanum commersonii TaxID=4109 RepID=A0A9J5XDS5_SOLCO|nr:hypothetical protein H5410_046965 [Solanum commersonii]
MLNVKIIWDKMLQFSRLDKPWCTIGDFNVITDIDEKMGGLAGKDLVDGNPMIIFQLKLKRVPILLATSLDKNMEIFLTVLRSMRRRLKVLKQISSIYLKIEQSTLKQKTQLQWFKDGDENSKYIHAIIRGRRSKLFIHKISDDHGNTIKGDENIARAACCHFEKIFTGEDNLINEEVLRCILGMITEYQNQKLQAMPTKEELKQAVWSMSANSVADPDGISGMFSIPAGISSVMISLT